MTDCMQQVRFSQARTAINKQWVVSLGWLLCHSYGSSVCKPITSTDNKCIECVLVVQATKLFFVAGRTHSWSIKVSFTDIFP